MTTTKEAAPNTAYRQAREAKAKEIAGIINDYHRIRRGDIFHAFVEGPHVTWINGGSIGSAGWAYTFGMAGVNGCVKLINEWCNEWEASPYQQRRAIECATRLHDAFQGWLIEPYDSSTAYVVEKV